MSNERYRVKMGEYETAPIYSLHYARQLALTYTGMKQIELGGYFIRLTDVTVRNTDGVITRRSTRDYNGTSYIVAVITLYRGEIR